MSKYVYPAIFAQEADGYYVRFPDIPSCFTDGDTLIEAMENANEVLALMLYQEKNIPKATPIKELKTENNEFATLIYCNTDNYKITECTSDEQ